MEKKYPCPRCKKLTSWENNPFKPFCSKRCKWVDLGKWLLEEYRIPAEENEAKPAEEENSDNDL